MCDETTTGSTAAVTDAPLAGLTETTVEVPTPDGACEAFFVHPAEGRYPGVIFWPDAFGVRPATRNMARRLAAAGFAVLAVNQYYRTERLPLGLSFDMLATEEGRAKLFPVIRGVTPDMIGRDAAAHVAFLDAQASVDTSRGIGTQGYCMGGALALRTAAAVPERVKAAASFHGGGLVTEAPDSPHRLFADARASYLIAIGSDDDARAPDDKDALRAAAAAAGRPCEIEVYDAQHSWCVPDAPVFDAAEADRAFDRLMALYVKL